jgi:salicylate hydroxylase
VKAAVVGGGIGGLTAAIALRAKRIDVVVLERAPELHAVGASLELGPNAVRLLDELGLGHELRRVGVRPEAVELVRWDDGSVLLHTRLGAAMESHFGGPLLDFFRPDLHAVLHAALPRDAIVFGARVVRIDQDDEGVSVQLEDGASVQADAAVAADGIRSPLRAQLLGEDEPVFSGTVVYRGVLPRDGALDVHPEPVNRYWIGPYRHGVSYWISARRLLAVNAAAQDAKWARESWTDPAPADELLPYFAGWHPSLLEHIRRTPVFLRGAVFVRKPLAQWSVGRVTLLGDAAHAMEPFQAQGAAQAVEDAYVLAECLADADDDVAGALARYEQLRTARAAELQELSRTAGDRFYLPDGDEQRERDSAYETLHERYAFGHRQAIWEHDVRDALGPSRV